MGARSAMKTELAIILDAYEEVEGRDFRDRVALALGLTVPEAYESGLLPVRVTAALRRDDPVTQDQVRAALIAQGASVLDDAEHPELRFSTTEEAEECVRRLVEFLPGSASLVRRSRCPADLRTDSLRSTGSSSPRRAAPSATTGDYHDP